MDFPGPASAAGKRRAEGRHAKENVRRCTLQYVALIFRVQRGRRGYLLRVAALLASPGFALRGEPARRAACPLDPLLLPPRPRPHDHMARIVLTCMAGIVPNNPSAFPPFLEVRCTNVAGAGDRQGKVCSYNPFAFPPFLAVRCRKVRLQGRRR